MKIFNLILIVSLLLACKDDNVAIDGNELAVQFGETVTGSIDGKSWSVTFQSVEESSLCPEDVICVWQGRLVVQLQINGQTSILGIGDLSTNTEREIPNSTFIDGTTITLIEAKNTEVASFTKLKLAFD